ncbi:unnamed protein product [Callosobruchus maculatus]|uniref:Swi5-dependent recombination DNA repair protein 1 homolog n=1 Tax=Callosobruchus maculatus TaxID=64391 RepID=A0A653C223_CALMS|nr:unnamed protein product [Callosobruchus maculatus]
MSYTPETKSTHLQKFSPFGVGISKTLLTPCRRVGLSRKRSSQSTPISIIKTPTESPNANLLNEDSSKTTPVGYERSSCKGKQSRSLSRDIQLVKKNFLDNKSVKNSSCKKVLAQNFALERCDQASGPTDGIGDLGVSTTDGNTIDLQIDIENEQDNLSIGDKNIETQGELQNSENNQKETILEAVNKISLENIQDVKTEGKGNINSTLEDSDANLKNKKKENPEKSKRSHKSTEKLPLKKAVKDSAVYDSDDDFIPLDSKLLKKRKSSIAENPLKSNSTSSLKACSVTLERLDSERSVKTKSFITSDNDDSFDSEFVVRKKKKFVIEDDKDSIDSSLKNELSKLPKVVSNLHEDDEDMAFTSTPEQDKNEKKKLIKMVTDLENSIKEKKKKLEDLTQASIYKNKHNVKELDALTNIWKTGCESGLKSLLKQLQSHGPMDMATLLEKLHIPPDVAGQLSLSDSQTENLN